MVFDLPCIFALRRYRTNIQEAYPELEPFEDIACLVCSEHLGENKYTFTLLVDPIDFLGESSMVEYEERPADFTHIRVLDGKDEMATVVSQGCLNINTATGKIPVLQFLNPCRVLMDEFMDLKGHPELYFWCKNKFQIGTSIAVQKQRKGNDSIVQKQTYPQHIVNLIVEDAIQHKKQCPIQFEDLTKESTRVTPCGHIMSADGAVCWIRAKNSCPVCRVACSVGDLQTWK